jgi:hypothetical protein
MCDRSPRGDCNTTVEGKYLAPSLGGMGAFPLLATRFYLILTTKITKNTRVDQISFVNLVSETTVPVRHGTKFQK